MKRLIWISPAAFFCLCFVFSQTPPRSGSQTQVPGKTRPSGLSGTETNLEETKIRRESSAPPGYKGVVMADVNPKNTYKDEVVVDFGGLGLWVYEQMTWHQISGLNPDWILSVSLDDPPGKEVVVDFGAQGLWRWAYNGYPGDWEQISGNNSMWALALDDDGDGRQELHVNFGPGPGLWRYEEGTGGERSWEQISAISPSGGLRSDLSPPGQEDGCYLFPGIGVWTIAWSGKEADLRQLTGTEDSNAVFAAAGFVGGGGEDLVLDFGAKGIWLCQARDRVWHQISALIPGRIREVRFGAGGDRLVIDFNSSQGLFVWSFAGYPGTLAKLHHADPDSGFCEPFDPDGPSEKTGEQELAIDFGASGLWKYDFSRRTWTLLNTKNPEFMVAGDYWNEGSDATLAVDFGSDGLWLYEGRFGGWFKISANSPDGQ